MTDPTDTSTTLSIKLPQAEYDVHIGFDLAPLIIKAQQDLQYDHRSSAIITDRTVEESQSDFLDQQFTEIPRFVIPSGEPTKNLDTLRDVYNFMVDSNLDRASTLFAFGGGVVGDIAGFAAATYMRGIDYYQVPTTLLAMVDSAIGGKTGVNLTSGKSLVGAFHQPKGVFADLNCLKTLSPAQFNSGMAEVIKSALLADIALFELLEKEKLTPESPQLVDVIKQTVAIKAQIVTEDERETSGRRALLNLGHTFAHAIESTSHYTEYLHGEAVALGLILAAKLSVFLGYISDNEVDRIIAVIEKYNLPTQLKTPLPFEQLHQAMLHDKKVHSGELPFVILESLGSAAISKVVDPKWLHVILREAGATD